MELLIVVVVIAILAAISVVAYRGVANNAQAAAIRANLAQAANKLEMYKVDNGGYPPDQATVAGLVNFDSSTALTYAASGSTSAPAYCLVASQGAQQSSVGSANRTPSVGACVVNLATDPAATGATGGTGEWGTRYSWTGAFLTAGGPASGPATLHRISVNAGSVGVNRGNDFYTNVDILPATSGAAISHPVAAGTTYSLSAWVRASHTGNALVTGRVHDGAGNWSSAALDGPAVMLAANNWTRIALTFTASNTGYAAFRLGINSTGWLTTDTFDATGLMFTQGSTLYNYADGNSPGWSWSGTPNASASFGPPL